MSKIRIAILVISAIAVDIQAASPANLPLKPKHVHEKVLDRQREITPAAKELLFQEYLEWLKNRTIEDIFREAPLALRPSIVQ